MTRYAVKVGSKLATGWSQNKPAIEAWAATLRHQGHKGARVVSRAMARNNPAKRPAQVPAKVWDNYRRIFGGSITPDAAKLIAREYRKKVTNVAKKRTTAKRRNPGSNPGKSLSLRNFTGKIRLNPDKTVSVLGVGRKKKAAKKTATRRKR